MSSSPRQSPPSHPLLPMFAAQGSAPPPLAVNCSPGLLLPSYPSTSAEFAATARPGLQKNATEAFSLQPNYMRRYSFGSSNLFPMDPLMSYGLPFSLHSPASSSTSAATTQPPSRSGTPSPGPSPRRMSLGPGSIFTAFASPVAQHPNEFFSHWATAGEPRPDRPERRTSIPFNPPSISSTPSTILPGSSPPPPPQLPEADMLGTHQEMFSRRDSLPFHLFHVNPYSADNFPNANIFDLSAPQFNSIPSFQEIGPLPINRMDNRRRSSLSTTLEQAGDIDSPVLSGSSMKLPFPIVPAIVRTASTDKKFFPEPTYDQSAPRVFSSTPRGQIPKHGVALDHQMKQEYGTASQSHPETQHVANTNARTSSQSPNLRMPDLSSINPATTDALLQLAAGMLPSPAIPLGRLNQFFHPAGAQMLSKFESFHLHDSSTEQPLFVDVPEKNMCIFCNSAKQNNGKFCGMRCLTEMQEAKWQTFSNKSLSTILQDDLISTNIHIDGTGKTWITFDLLSPSQVEMDFVTQQGNLEQEELSNPSPGRSSRRSSVSSTSSSHQRVQAAPCDKCELLRESRYQGAWFCSLRCATRVERLKDQIAEELRTPILAYVADGEWDAQSRISSRAYPRGKKKRKQTNYQPQPAPKAHKTMEESEGSTNAILKCELCDKQHSGSYGRGRFCGATCARRYSIFVRHGHTTPPQK